MPAPSEIIAAPLTLWLNDVGAAFPDLDDLDAALVSASWIKLGTEGANNYDESGVNLSHSETVFDFTPSGSTMAVKRFRTGEEFKFKLNLVDVSPAQYALVMNDAAVTTISAGSGIAGEKKFSLYRGIQVNSFAVIARGMSSVDNDLVLQYEFSKAFVSVNGEAVFNKGVATNLPVEVMAVRHSSSDKIQARIQTAEAT